MLPELPSLGFQPNFYTGPASRFHMPFLYELVASHRPRKVVVLGFGDEQVHFTICQAAREQEVACRCLTIRRPARGENAQDDEAWRKAISESQEFFGDVGTLRARDSVELAVEYEDGSVDLLLI